ncbi:hypothetical protein Hanom_Chr16g01483071 [Helianthus anomalus]
MVEQSLGEFVAGSGGFELGGFRSFAWPGICSQMKGMAAGFVTSCSGSHRGLEAGSDCCRVGLDFATELVGIWSIFRRAGDNRLTESRGAFKSSCFSSIECIMD